MSKVKDYIYRPEIECLSRSEFENLQSERLRKTVELVYNNCKPYRAKMDACKLKPSDIRSVADLQKLPFTVKHDLREAYPFGFYSAPARDIVEVHASSGTTGKLTVDGYTQNDVDVWAEVAARSLAMAGVTKDSLVHVAYGYGLFTGGLGAHYGAQQIGASTVPASAGNTIRQLTLLRDFGATHLCCTPSYAIFLGTEIRKAGMDIPGICRRAARIIVVRRGNHMENIGAMLKQINDRLHAQADATLKENGLTFTQARVLRYLHRAGGQASQKALGDYLEVAHPTIVGIVSRLEREGFVTCSTGVADRRSKVVCLTAKAVAIRDCMDRSIRKTEQRLVAGLSQEEVDQLRGLLTRLHRNLE